MSTLTYYNKEKDLQRGPLIENPCKHHFHNAAAVKEYLFSSTAMLHCLKPTVNYLSKKFESSSNHLICFVITRISINPSY